MNVKGTPQNLVPAKKGEVRNPNGRPKEPAEIATTRKQRKAEFELLVYELQDMTKDELKKTIQDPRSSILRVQLASQMMFAIREGDTARMNTHLTWTFGKPTSTVELSGPDGGPINVNHNHSGRVETALKDFTTRELIALVRKSDEVLGKLEDGEDIPIDDLEYFMQDDIEDSESSEPQ